MASISLTQDLTVSGSDLVSAYNDNYLLIKFIPTDSSKDITCKIKVTSTGQLFDCFNYAIIEPSTVDYYFRINLIDIVRYYMTDFYYKTVASGINASSLVWSLSIYYYGYEDGVQTATGNTTLRFSHGKNQIGYQYGSNMKYLHDADDLTYTAFKDYPFELYFYTDGTYTLGAMLNGSLLPVSASLTEGMKTIKHDDLNVTGNNTVSIYGGSGTEKITGWTNASPAFDTFASTGTSVTVASETTENGALCETNSIAVTSGNKYLIQFTITKSNPTSDTPVLKFGITPITFTFGVQKSFIFTAESTAGYTLSLSYASGQGGSIGGTFSIKQVTYEQDINLNVKSTDCEGLYIRYLSKEGFYRYWLFNKYYSETVNGQKIGYIYPYVSTLVGAQYRRQITGYENAFEEITAISHNVSKADQAMLMDLFTSPAVYIWNGSKGDASAETDWVLVDEVKGSHSINHKRNYQSFQVTFVMPELYTQKR